MQNSAEEIKKLRQSKRDIDKEIKRMEKSLQYLVDNFDPKETVPFHPAHGNYKL